MLFAQLVSRARLASRVPFSLLALGLMLTSTSFGCLMFQSGPEPAGDDDDDDDDGDDDDDASTTSTSDASASEEDSASDPSTSADNDSTDDSHDTGKSDSHDDDDDATSSGADDETTSGDDDDDATATSGDESSESGSDETSGSDDAGDDDDDDTARCNDANLNWRSGSKTTFESYPDPNSEECLEFNGCEYIGQFAACHEQRSEQWVMEHNIIAVYPDFQDLALHDLCLRWGDSTIIVTVLDTCADSDCSGCCTRNQGSSDQLIDVEMYTAMRWGLEDNADIEWADLGPTAGGGCE